ncbi:myosin-light-chain kinase [Besnoitia besnoiti]|uniref:Myosin-light-chain kinase n=1 Tax=Besnoitia besnoiti TaxID=94643 RepID=A0A2A9MCD6_BESBE|nr:myosin-light-chain kinase [Besnoitia besnoiti]PFH35645.1 myosin-light-chain kinase [Besnoitia besnoiti]
MSCSTFARSSQAVAASAATAPPPVSRHTGGTGCRPVGVPSLRRAKLKLCLPDVLPNNIPLRRTSKSCFDGYRVLETVGSGTYANVWKVVRANPEAARNHGEAGGDLMVATATHTLEGEAHLEQLKPKDKREVFAAKLLQPQKFPKDTLPRVLDMFAKEIVNLAACQCPGVVRVEEVVEGSEGWLIVQEYVDGGTVWCEQVCNDEDDAFLHFIQLVQAVLFLQEQKVMHRDLKPTNILRSRREKRIVLADFGWSERVDQCQLTPMEWPGTLEINPPEVINSTGPLTERIDNYAIGMALLLFLSGRFICRQKGLDAATAAPYVLRTVQQLRSSPPPSVFRGSADAWILFLGLTAPHPTNRWSLNRVLSHGWVQRKLVQLAPRAFLWHPNVCRLAAGLARVFENPVACSGPGFPSVCRQHARAISEVGVPAEKICVGGNACVRSSSGAVLTSRGVLATAEGHKRVRSANREACPQCCLSGCGGHPCNKLGTQGRVVSREQHNQLRASLGVEGVHAPAVSRQSISVCSTADSFVPTDQHTLLRAGIEEDRSRSRGRLSAPACQVSHTFLRYTPSAQQRPSESQLRQGAEARDGAAASVPSSAPHGSMDVRSAPQADAAASDSSHSSSGSSQHTTPCAGPPFPGVTQNESNENSPPVDTWDILEQKRRLEEQLDALQEEKRQLQRMHQQHHADALRRSLLLKTGGETVGQCSPKQVEHSKNRSLAHEWSLKLCMEQSAAAPKRAATMGEVPVPEARAQVLQLSPRADKVPPAPSPANVSMMASGQTWNQKNHTEPRQGASKGRHDRVSVSQSQEFSVEASHPAAKPFPQGLKSGSHGVKGATVKGSQVEIYESTKTNADNCPSPCLDRRLTIDTYGRTIASRSREAGQTGDGSFANEREAASMSRQAEECGLSPLFSQMPSRPVIDSSSCVKASPPNPVRVAVAVQEPATIKYKTSSQIDHQYSIQDLRRSCASEAPGPYGPLSRAASQDEGRLVRTVAQRCLPSRLSFESPLADEPGTSARCPASGQAVSSPMTPRAVCVANRTGASPAPAQWWRGCASSTRPLGEATTCKQGHVAVKPGDPRSQAAPSESPGRIPSLYFGDIQTLRLQLQRLPQQMTAAYGTPRVLRRGDCAGNSVWHPGEACPPTTQNGLSPSKSAGDDGAQRQTSSLRRVQPAGTNFRSDGCVADEPIRLSRIPGQSLSGLESAGNSSTATSAVEGGLQDAGEDYGKSSSQETISSFLRLAGGPGSRDTRMLGRERDSTSLHDSDSWVTSTTQGSPVELLGRSQAREGGGSTRGSVTVAPSDLCVSGRWRPTATTGCRDVDRGHARGAIADSARQNIDGHYLRATQKESRHPRSRIGEASDHVVLAVDLPPGSDASYDTAADDRLLRSGAALATSLMVNNDSQGKMAIAGTLKFGGMAGDARRPGEAFRPPSSGTKSASATAQSRGPGYGETTTASVFRLVHRSPVPMHNEVADTRGQLQHGTSCVGVKSGERINHRDRLGNVSGPEEPWMVRLGWQYRWPHQRTTESPVVTEKRKSFWECHSQSGVAEIDTLGSRVGRGADQGNTAEGTSSESGSACPNLPSTIDHLVGTDIQAGGGHSADTCKREFQLVGKRMLYPVERMGVCGAEENGGCEHESPDSNEADAVPFLQRFVSHLLEFGQDLQSHTTESSRKAEAYARVGEGMPPGLKRAVHEESRNGAALHSRDDDNFLLLRQAQSAGGFSLKTTAHTNAHQLAQLLESGASPRKACPFDGGLLGVAPSCAGATTTATTTGPGVGTQPVTSPGGGDDGLDSCWSFHDLDCEDEPTEFRTASPACVPIQYGGRPA